MIENYLRPGGKLDITRRKPIKPKEGEPEEKPNYRSNISDVVSDDEIVVTIPTEKGKLILYSVGEKLDLCFYTDKGLYQCYAQVASRAKEGGLYTMRLELTTELKKFQRREYYRFNTILNMKCRTLNQDEKEHMNEVEFIDADLTLENGVLVDISGGGTRFISTHPYEKGDLILFRFSLEQEAAKAEKENKEEEEKEEDDERYSVIGKVIMSTPMEKQRGKYENRIEFVRISRKDREEIIRYIFEEERRKRKKETR